MYGNSKYQPENQWNRRQKFQKQTASNAEHPPVPDFSMQDLFGGKHLELVAAALLLSGKLKVDSVEIFRRSPVVSVTLLGKYLKQDNDNANALADFLEENGDMTIDDVFEGLQKRMERGR